MTQLRRLLLLVCVACFFGAALQAQDTIDPYAEIAQSRTADGAFVLGEPSAAVKLIEFSDFLCGSCQNYKPIIDTFIREQVATGHAQFEYRMFPVIDPHLSPLSAQLAECADTLVPGAFWRAHDAMFELVSTDGFTAETAAVFAARLGLDTAAMQTCAENARQVSIDAAYGAKLGVRGTPSLFVQYGDGAPVQIALALPEHFPAVANALRPDSSDVVTIEHGRYAGLATWRRADGGFVLGDPDAPLTIVAFEDFLCAHCQAYGSTVQQFIEQFVRSGAAQFEFRFYPLVNPQYSTYTASVAECVAMQDLGSFWDAHDLLFEFAGAGTLDNLETAVANLLDLDAAALENCLGRSVQFLIDTQLGQSAGVTGTPALRARAANGPMDVLYADGQPLDRGGLPLELLQAFATGSAAVTLGAPQRSLLNDSFLRDTSLITGEPCAPPCWQSIVPGETSMADAAAIVETLDGMTIAQADEYRLILAQTDGDPCCHIWSEDGETVATILLQFAPNIGIGEVIAAYGEPPFVGGQPFNETEAALSFYYPEEQMLLYAMVAGADGILEESSPVVSAIFATESIMAAALGAAPFDYWKGYLSYSEYMDGEYDYTP